MTPYKQLVLHRPPEAAGDCFRTCVACLLDVEPAAVRHFYDGVFDLSTQEARNDHYNGVRAWLREVHDLDLLPLIGGNTEHLEWYPRGLCIATGQSPRFAATKHSVVWRLTGEGLGELVHDPHPDGTGILGDPEQYEFLVPLNPGGPWLLNHNGLNPASVAAEIQRESRFIAGGARRGRGATCHNIARGVSELLPEADRAEFLQAAGVTP